MRLHQDHHEYPHEGEERDTPRYRFAWDNLPPALLRQLGRDLHLQPPVAPALRAQYGARPKPEFVRDAWPTLLDAWLAKDSCSRKLAVDKLKARHLGNVSAPVRSAAAQLDYLRSCRNSTSLREVVVVIFSAYGEPTPVRLPVPSPTPEHSPIVTPGPEESSRPNDAAGSTESPASLNDWLGGAVAEILDVDEVRHDEDGDIPVRIGSTMCYVRSTENPPSVALFAIMVVEVPRTPGLLEALNDINMNLTMGRVFHTPTDEVLFVLELYGDQLTVEIISVSLAAAMAVADRFDDQLQAQFGGKTIFAETSDESVMV